MLKDLGVTSGAEVETDTSIPSTKVEFTKSNKQLDGIIIDGVSYLQINKLRDIGVKVDWDNEKKKVIVNL